MIRFKRIIFYINREDYHNNLLVFYGKMGNGKIRRINVERTLVKTAAYSFIISFLLLLVFIQRVR